MMSSTSIIRSLNHIRCYLVIFIIVATYCDGTSCMEYLTNLTPISGDPAINEEWGNYPALMGDGNSYNEQMVIHPPENGQAFVEWNLNAQYLRFTAVIGPINDPCGTPRFMRFIISVDTAVVYTSQDFSSKTQYANIDIDVTGKNILRITTDAVGSACGDHATVANPILTCPNEWVSPAPTMVSQYIGKEFQMGVWQDNIYLIPFGQYGTFTQTEVVVFNPIDETFSTINNNPITAPSHGQDYGYSLQIGNILYYTINVGGQLGLETFDLSTKQMASNSIPTFIPADYVQIHHPVGVANTAYRCADQNYIYIVGGYYNNFFTLFDISGNQWYDAPKMNAQRYDGSCAVAPNGKLYGIGGFSGGGETTVETISRTNILSNSWVYINDQFPNHVWGANAVVYGTDIYVMGSETINDLVYIIDTTTDTITLSPQRLAFPNGEASAVLFDNAIYLFGGSANNGQWQMLRLGPSSITQLTDEPSTSPTKAPSKFPTESPTYQVCNLQELDWNALNTVAAQLSEPIITSSWD
eukprot:297038_1